MSACDSALSARLSSVLLLHIRFIGLDSFKKVLTLRQLLQARDALAHRPENKAVVGIPDDFLVVKPRVKHKQMKSWANVVISKSDAAYPLVWSGLGHERERAESRRVAGLS